MVRPLCVPRSSWFPRSAVGTHTRFHAPAGLQPSQYAFPFMPCGVRWSVGARSRGFTLLEMLLVLFLIGLMASAGLMLTENVEDQARYDETKRRMELVRRAIVGDTARSINGSAEIGGFAADMGRLPDCLAELLAPFDCADPANPLPLWSEDANSGLAAGWRGPYVQALPDFDGARRLPDAYGNDDGGPNFGWGFLNDAGAIRLQSSGLNGIFDGASGDDYPAGATLDLVPALVNVFDYRVDFRHWDTLTIRFENISNNVIAITQNSLRLVLSYADDALGTSDSAAFPSANLVIPSASVTGSVAVTTADTLSVPIGASLTDTTLSFTGNGEVRFPGGSFSVAADNTVTVPTGSSLAGTSVTIGSNGNVIIPAGSMVTLNTALAGLPDVFGYYSLIVACDDATNLTAVDGKRFDGDCTRYGDEDNPIAYTPLNQPYLFGAVPRANVVLPPSPLIWTLL